MAKRNRPRGFQIIDGEWFRDRYTMHECCNPECRLVHDVEYKLEDGHLWAKWTTNEKETARNRREIAKRRKKGASPFTDG